MAQSVMAEPLPDNNNCPMHEEYNFTCGTCNGYFDENGQPVK